MSEPTPPGELPLVTRARSHASRTALEAPEGTFTYGDVLHASEATAGRLLAAGGTADLHEERVAFLVGPGFRHVAVQWGIWRAGGLGVPLAVSHPPRELAHVLDDARPVVVVVAPELAERVAPLARERGIPLLETVTLEIARGGSGVLAAPTGSEDAEAPSRTLPAIATGRRAMMLYTSGTTGRPKGVVSTHANLEAQITALTQAWGWRADDRILHVLPLHHVHGIVNVLSCALWSGALCRMLGGFDGEETWDAIRLGDHTLFMAVPTIYARLLRTWEGAPEEERVQFAEACRRMRLMVSGSAALPVSVLERWREITGHTLLERYGMTEIGMALSNPLEGERRPGHVGLPLPGVGLRLRTEEGEEAAAGVSGEIEVRGAGVFLEYWRRPRETDESFRDGWFLTGDLAVLEEGSYRILGRRSVDIIKTGGYKVSALEVEEVLREHPQVRECAVVGLPDPEWGERVAAVVVLEEGAAEESADTLRSWAKERLAPYKAPTLFVPLAELPRNAMGKVTKPEVRSALERVLGGGQGGGS